MLSCRAADPQRVGASVARSSNDLPRRIYTGAVNGGTGPSMADWLQKLNLEKRSDRELTSDAVLEAFVVPGPKRDAPRGSQPRG